MSGYLLLTSNFEFDFPFSCDTYIYSFETRRRRSWSRSDPMRMSGPELPAAAEGGRVRATLVPKRRTSERPSAPVGRWWCENSHFFCGKTHTHFAHRTCRRRGRLWDTTLIGRWVCVSSCRARRFLAAALENSCYFLWTTSLLFACGSSRRCSCRPDLKMAERPTAKLTSGVVTTRAS